MDSYLRALDRHQSTRRMMWSSPGGFFWPGLEKSHITSHISCVRADCGRVWGILSMRVPIKKRKYSCGKYLAACYISYSVITAYLEICQMYVDFVSICIVHMLGSRATMSFPTTCCLHCKTFFSWGLLLMDNGKIPKYHTPSFQTVLFPSHVGLY